MKTKSKDELMKMDTEDLGSLEHELWTYREKVKAILAFKKMEE